MTDLQQVSGGTSPGGVLPDALPDRLEGIGGGQPTGGIGGDALVEVIGDDFRGGTPVIPFPGPAGPPGPGAYQTWLAQGNVGTEADFLLSLVPGPAGVPVYHAQDTPAAEWIVHHDLTAFPIVTVYDSSGAQLFADVEHPDASTVRVLHGAPTSGTVRLN